MGQALDFARGVGGKLAEGTPPPSEIALYEMAMKYWGVPFHVIESEWTDEQFFSLLECANERETSVQKKSRSNKSPSGDGSNFRSGSQTRKRSYSLLELTELKD